MLDPKLYPAQELEKLYFRRWNVELHFRQIKTMLGMDVLRCLTPRDMGEDPDSLARETGKSFFRHGDTRA